MATKVKGITIELGADASGLEKALKDVNKDLSTTQKQLTSVNKSLKLDPTNLELIEQKQRLLAQATQQTTEKLKALKAAQEKIGANVGSDPAAQGQYDALTREISDTQVHLNQLNAEQKTFSQTAQQAAAGASGFTAGLQGFTNAAQSVASATAGISAAAAAALGGMMALAVKGAATADEWATLSQQIGLSTDTIQKFQYASELIDVDMNTITGSITKMKSSLDSQRDTFQQIGVEVKDQRGHYRDIESIFWDTVSALGNIQNETERDTAAMKIFGRSANELAGIIDDGGQKMKELGNEAESMGLIVSEEDIAKLNQFNDTLDMMKTQINAALVQLAIPVMEALEPIIAAIASAIKKVAQLMSNMDPTLVKIISIVLLVVAAISPIASILGNIGVAMMGLQAVIPGVTLAVTQLGAAMASLAANPVTWIVLGIVAALAALAIAIYEIVEHWDEIKDAASSAMSAIQSSVQAGRGKIEEFADAVASKFAIIPQTVNTVAEAFKSLVDKVAGVATKIKQAFSDLASKAREAGASVMRGFADGLESVISSVTAAAQRMASAIRDVWSALTMDANRAGYEAASSYSRSYSSGNNISRYSLSSMFSSSSIRPGRSTSYAAESALMSAVNELTKAINQSSSASTNVNVELVGSAKNIFDTVRVQNTKLQTATGYHALA